MEDFISILILILLGLAPTIIKLVKGEKPTTPKSIPILEEEDEAEVLFETPEMQKNEPNLRNQTEYFTYETLTDSEDIVDKVSDSKREESLQPSDNKTENIPGLTLDGEEIYKGIIYAEILKRKY
jgi:hypothetical protein